MAVAPEATRPALRSKPGLLDGQEVPDLMDIAEVALKLDMSKKWVNDKINSGQLDAYKMGNRIGVTVESVQRLLANRRMLPRREGA